VLAAFARIETAPPAVQPERSPLSVWSMLRWQWLVPAAAVLAVGVVWTLVRPTLAPTGPPLAQLPTQRAEAPAASGGGAKAVEAEARQDVNRPAKTEERAAPSGKLTQPTGIQTAAKESPATPPASRSKAEPPAPPVPVIAQNVAAEPSKDKDVRAEALPVGEVAAAKPAPAPAPAAPAPAERAVFAAQGGAAREGATRVMATADAIQPAANVVSAGASVAWRVGPAGSIERSIDGRRTWQKQESGVTTNLVAGSAPSETTCWVVGQRGTVLRTADGHTWELMNPPAAVDLVSVSARDGLVATVIAADGRRFMTTDGGRTWQTP
jgi:hypothetical protein